MDFLSDFPYDVRRLEKGAFIECIRQKGTLGLSYDNELVTPGPHGIGLPCAITIETGGDLLKAVESAREGLEILPELGHKFVLTYREGESIFECCFLVTTEHDDWWQKYPIIS